MAQDDGKKVLVVGGAALLLFLLLSGSANADEPGAPTKPDPKPDPNPPKKGPGGFADPGGPSKPPPTVGGLGDLPRPPDEPPTDTDDPPLGDIVSAVPAEGTLYPVKQGDIFLGTGSRSITYRVLQRAGYEAASRAGDSPEGASAFGQQVAQRAANRTKYLQMILCSGWNDALYGTYGFGSDAFEGPAERSIRLLPMHDNVLAKLSAKQTPNRQIQLKTRSDRGRGNGRPAESGGPRMLELLWLPAINLEILWESGGTDVTPEGLVWPGTDWPMTQPPPWVSLLGVSVLESVDRTVWGCGLGEWVTA